MSKEQFSRNQLKWIAMVTMVLDHVGCIFVPVKTMPVCYYLLRGIGRVSFPLICFLLVQGFFYTHSRRKYLFRLWCFALVSEIPYDLAFFGRVWNPWNQNVFVTLAIGLMMLLGLFRTKEYVGKGWRIPISCGIVGDDDGLAALDHRHTAVGSPQVNSDYFCHGGACPFKKDTFES